MKHKELPKDDDDDDDEETTRVSETQDSKEKSKKDEKKDPKDKKKRKLFKKGSEKEPSSKFEGEGITFKGKMIGIEGVTEARGEGLCQEAFSRLKASLKCIGGHKQRILLNLSFEGIKIKEDKTLAQLHFHPVHTISFICQDATDPRAFGYIYGTPSLGYQIFAIKTEKQASHIILCLRELFQLALNQRKEKMDEAIQQQEAQKGGKGSAESLTNGKLESLPKEEAVEPIAVDNLLDLQSEMDSLQMGIAQMNTSINATTALASTSQTLQELSLLEQPTNEVFDPFRLQLPPEQPKNIIDLPSPFNKTDNNWEPTTPSPQSPPPSESSQTQDRYAAFADIDSVPSIFDQFKQNEKQENEEKELDELSINGAKVGDKARLSFADLDPLSTTQKTFLDKSDFFNDLKNPPKKILKDLISTSSSSLPSSPPPSIGNNTYEPIFLPTDSSCTPPPLLPPKKIGNFIGQRSQSKENWELPLHQGTNQQAKNPFNPFSNVSDPAPHMVPPDFPAPPPPKFAETPLLKPFGLSSINFQNAQNDIDVPPPPIPTPLRKLHPSSDLTIPSILSNGNTAKRPSLARNSFSMPTHDNEYYEKPIVPKSGLIPVSSSPNKTSIARPRPVPGHNAKLNAAQPGTLSSTESVESLSGSPLSNSRLGLKEVDDSTSLSGSDVSSLSNGPVNGRVSDGPVEDISILSPSENSIFKRNDDPFADDFFTSLPKRQLSNLKTLGSFKSSSLTERWEDFDSLVSKNTIAKS